MAKTVSFGVLHLGTSFSVTYLLTGNLAIAGAVTFVEPLVNTVMHYFFDKYWGHPKLTHLVRFFGKQRSSPIFRPAESISKG